MARAATVIRATVPQPGIAAGARLRLAPINAPFREMIMTTIRTGTARMPEPMKPSANSVEAGEPATEHVEAA